MSQVVLIETLISCFAPSVYLDRAEYLSYHGNLWLIYRCCVQSVYSKMSLAGILCKEDLSGTPTILDISSTNQSEEKGK